MMTESIEGGTYSIVQLSGEGAHRMREMGTDLGLLDYDFLWLLVK